MLRVILCSHNGERFIEAQLASIVDQCLSVDAIHVFDFASTDGTRIILNRLASRWPVLDVRLVDHAPGVVMSFAHAFAEILPVCQSNDVIFLSDQDDVWLPEKTRQMVACIERGRRDGDERILAFHDVRICDAALRPIASGFYQGRPFRIPKDLDRERLAIANPVVGHTIVTTKPLLELMLRSQRLSLYVMHDWALVLLAAHAGRIIYHDSVLGLYRQHEANILGAGTRRSITGYIQRGLSLCRLIYMQAAAFEQDYRRAVNMGNIADPPPFFPGRSPLAWRLAIKMIRHGHTIGHRLLGIMQLRYVLSRPTFGEKVAIVPKKKG